MVKGPFASVVGVGRAEPEWANLNLVKDVCGKDPFFEAGETSEAPLPLPPIMTNGDLSTCPKHVDLLIVGAGLSGGIIAERCSKEFGYKSLILDVRDHIGGNCYDYVEEHGLRASKYGAHLFHTKFERVWEYVNEFSEWMPFDHRVKGLVPDKDGVKKLVPIPPTYESVNILFGENIKDEKGMEEWYKQNRQMPASGKDPANSEEAALSRVGPALYDRIFKHYTKKQWDKYPVELDASVMMRLPCRTTSDDRYFPDQWQALPLRGYTRIFENMLLRDPNITIRLNVDYFKAAAEGKLPSYGLLVYTGPIDSYFAQVGMPKLEYRSIRFIEEYVAEPADGFFQEAMVVNYPSPDVEFTRIVEYKHVPNQPEAVKRGEVKGSLIAKEVSSAVGDPYYPVPNPKNNELYLKYKELAEKETGVCFVGRLASYKYFNMDQAILNALEMFDNLKETGKLAPKRDPKDFGPGDGPK
jgi:UDP-galactopyranose mutase